MFIVSIGSAAVLYSAWYMELPFFSLGWLLYCLAWIPLLMIFVSAAKYDNKNPREPTRQNTTHKLNRALQK